MPGLAVASPSGKGAALSAAAPPDDLDVDVCILGAGILGLCTALVLLREDKHLKVALLDREVPCSGATGAGQGYLWLAHRDVGTPAYKLAVRSRQMWAELLAPTVPELSTQAVEWQASGSMLLATSEAEGAALRQRRDRLAAAGVEGAQVLSAAEVHQLEPSLATGAVHSGLLVPSDSQVSGKATAAALLRACEAHGPRFTALFHEAASQLVTGPTGRVEGVVTEARWVRAAHGVVVTLGAWSGIFLAQQLSDARWEGAFKPRRGLLLEMPRPDGMPAVRHGLMEMGYTAHYAHSSSSGQPTADGGLDITFTTTTSAASTLLVGSSREFCGFGREGEDAVVDAIMQRAAHFVPGLAAVQRQDISVRSGPRPWAAAGTPWVGPVPGMEGLFLSAGHEGSGLTLAPASAALLLQYLLGEPAHLEGDVVDHLAVPSTMAPILAE
ncbi:FAD-dependent oxidoreductase domain-containing 1 [Chlorella sorokiniana]|uniref:FAD-dependent oxidoreductase domain-containing protein 1 n=1 Tax=Chlorella sorokiniana TaxID=3076 RepID=A0A2P6TYQ1_CHLSO|nr:FAD-dependent oxidoreductase domain-containing 1 [Chlorella sorokiniana]|eukprot:PRW59188.1 FAD-dependent oxidoreductase domain-containing 1 [Chlorella sorokiniana]